MCACQCPTQREKIPLNLGWLVTRLDYTTRQTDTGLALGLDFKSTSLWKPLTRLPVPSLLL